MSAPETAPRGIRPQAPDPRALRRRVLLTGLLALGLFFAVSLAITSRGLSSAWALVAAALGYLLVVRPLMRPVRHAAQLRRALAYQAFLDGRQPDGPR